MHTEDVPEHVSIPNCPQRCLWHHALSLAQGSLHVKLLGFKPQNQTFFQLFQTGQNVQERLGSGAFSAIGGQSLFRELAGGRHCLRNARIGQDAEPSASGCLIDVVPAR